MSLRSNRLIHARGLVVALAVAVLPGCAVTTGAGQGRLTFQGGFTTRYTVCTGVHASRLRDREGAGRDCRQHEGLRVIL